MRLYHLSYDTIDCKKHFNDDYSEARRYLLCVLAHTPIEAIESYCESTMILHYETEKPTRLFEYLDDNLSKYFYFSVSLIARDKNSFDLLHHNPNNDLNDRLNEEWDNLDCSSLGKRITNY